MLHQSKIIQKENLKNVYDLNQTSNSMDMLSSYKTLEIIQFYFNSV